MSIDSLSLLAAAVDVAGVPNIVISRKYLLISEEVRVKVNSDFIRLSKCITKIRDICVVSE